MNDDFSVQLIAKSKHGKDVIHNHGSQWMLLRESFAVAAKLGQGKCCLLESPDGDKRWVAENDEDFEIVQRA